MCSFIYQSSFYKDPFNKNMHIGSREKLQIDNIIPAKNKKNVENANKLVELRANGKIASQVTKSAETSKYLKVESEKKATVNKKRKYKQKIDTSIPQIKNKKIEIVPQSDDVGVQLKYTTSRSSIEDCKNICRPDSEIVSCDNQSTSEIDNFIQNQLKNVNDTTSISSSEDESDVCSLDKLQEQNCSSDSIPLAKRRKTNQKNKSDFASTTWMDIIKNPHMDVNIKKKAINCINEKIAFLSILHNNNKLYLEKRGHRFDDPKDKTWKSVVDSVYDTMVQQNKKRHYKKIYLTKKNSTIQKQSSTN